MGLFDNPDSGGLVAGQAVASGLQGLVEAYKIKLQAAQEEQKVKQSGYNSYATQAFQMPFKLAGLVNAQANLNEKSRHNQVTEAQNDMGGAADALAGGIRAGTVDPNTVPKRGPVYAKVINALTKQNTQAGESGPLDLVTPTGEARTALYASGQRPQQILASTKALSPLLDSLKEQIGYDPKTASLGGNTPLSSVPLLNRIKSYGAEQSGSDTYTGINANIVAIQKELNMMAANGGSDKNLALAAEMIKPNASPKQLLKGIQAIERMAGGRSEAYAGENPMASSGAMQGKYEHLSDAELAAALNQ